MSSTIVMSQKELKDRRQALLEQARMSYDQLRERAESYTLRPEERDIWEGVRTIDYLLTGE